MGKYDLEIISPRRDLQNVNGGQSLPVGYTPQNPGGIVSSALTRWEANRHARVFEAQTGKTRALTALYDAQTAAVDAYVRRESAAQRYRELPATLAHESARRQAERDDEIAEMHHRRELADMRRMSERARAESALVDAEQALRAQREYGYLSHELVWKQRQVEVAGVELDAAERRALLREAQNGSGRSSPLTEDELIEQLYAKREELRADGLDTGRIDAALAGVGRGRK